MQAERLQCELHCKDDGRSLFVKDVVYLSIIKRYIWCPLVSLSRGLYLSKTLKRKRILKIYHDYTGRDLTCDLTYTSF